MRIEPDGDGFSANLQDGDSQELADIVTRHLPDWLTNFSEKNKDYGSGAMYELGVRGQYSDIHRKMIKLKRSMWDGEELKFESTGEVIKDLISHLFLTLHMMGLQEEARDEYIYSGDDKAALNFVNMFDDDSKAFNLAAELPEELRKKVQAIVIKRAKDQAAQRAEKEQWLLMHPEEVQEDEDGVRIVGDKIWIDSQQRWARLASVGLQEPRAEDLQGDEFTAKRLKVMNDFKAGVITQDKAEDLLGETVVKDEWSLPKWLHNRYGLCAPSDEWSAKWEDLIDSDKEYWYHEARAVQRAVVRGGFRDPQGARSGPVEGLRRLAEEKFMKDAAQAEERRSREEAEARWSGDEFAEGDLEQSVGYEEAKKVVKGRLKPFSMTLTGTMSPEAADVVMGKGVNAPEPMAQVPMRVIREVLSDNDISMSTWGKLYRAGNVGELYKGGSGL